MSSRYLDRIRLVLDHIHDHLDGDLSVETLAGVAGFSSFHFHLVFTGLVGETVKAHVKRLRLERAAFLLRHTERAVVEIALDTGYETQESFTRAFKAAFGLPPKRFKKSHQPKDLYAPSAVHFDGSGTFAPIMNTTPDSVQLETRPAMVGIGLRHVGPYTSVGATFDALCQWAGRRGLFGPNTCMFGLAYDDPEVTAPEFLRYDACLSVDADKLAALELSDGVQRIQVPAAEYASILHVGPYAEFGSTYAELVGRWLPQSGREAAVGPCLEINLNSPRDTAPADLKTRIHLPLQP